MQGLSRCILGPANALLAVPDRTQASLGPRGVRGSLGSGGRGALTAQWLHHATVFHVFLQAAGPAPCVKAAKHKVRQKALRKPGTRCNLLGFDGGPITPARLLLDSTWRPPHVPKMRAMTFVMVVLAALLASTQAASPASGLKRECFCTRQTQQRGNGQLAQGPLAHRACCLSRICATECISSVASPGAARTAGAHPQRVLGLKCQLKAGRT